MEGSDRTCEDTEDTTMLVQIEETMRSVRSSHATSGTSLIIVVRLHTFKTVSQFSVLELRNSVFPVKIIVGLIRKLDMTESVFETLTSITIMHETETNTNNTTL
jgi:hypothetical protein